MVNTGPKVYRERDWYLVLRPLYLGWQNLDLENNVDIKVPINQILLPGTFVFR